MRMTAAGALRRHGHQSVFDGGRPLFADVDRLVDGQILLRVGRVGGGYRGG